MVAKIEPWEHRADSPSLPIGAPRVIPRLRFNLFVDVARVAKLNAYLLAYLYMHTENGHK